MNILVTGANGQLGREIRTLIPEIGGYNFYFTDMHELDITKLQSLRDYIELNKINFVINCAAYTSVDKAESEPELAELINRTGPANLAKISGDLDIPIIHISTDFVFDGSKGSPYLETDKTTPLSVYGKTKLDGEQEIIKTASTFAIIRTSWLYSEFGNNFVKTIIKLGNEKSELRIIADQIGTPTYARDLAEVIIDMIPKIKKNTKEVFNYSNDGAASWYDFAVKIIELTGVKCKVLPILTSEYPTPARRPKYSVMDKTKIKNYLNIKIPLWSDSLADCINNMRSNL